MKRTLNTLNSEYMTEYTLNMTEYTLSIRWDWNPGHIGERSQELIVPDCLISAAS